MKYSNGPDAQRCEPALTEVARSDMPYIDQGLRRVRIEAVTRANRELGILACMAEVVEAAWYKVLTDASASAVLVGTPLSESFAALVRVAHTEPKLRQLYPWTGMWELHFSRCTEHRYTWDVLYIGTLADGRYYVEGPGRDIPRIAETDDAAAAMAIVIERLPLGCGPAFIGTADELAAHEQVRRAR